MSEPPKKRPDKATIVLWSVVGVMFAIILYLFIFRDSIRFLPDSVSEHFGREKYEEGSRPMKAAGTWEKTKLRKSVEKGKMPTVKHQGK